MILGKMQAFFRVFLDFCGFRCEPVDLHGIPLFWLRCNAVFGVEFTGFSLWGRGEFS